MKVSMELTDFDEIMTGLSFCLVLCWGTYARIDMNPLHSVVLCTYGK